MILNHFKLTTLALTLLVAGSLVTGCNYSIDKGSRGSGVGQKPTSPNENGKTSDPNEDGDSSGNSADEIAAPKFSEVHPILIAQCNACHSESRRAAGVSVETWDSLVGNSRAIIPGDAENSGIYASVTDDYMPVASAVSRGVVRALTAEEKEALRLWINAGALNN